MYRGMNRFFTAAAAIVILMTGMNIYAAQYSMRGRVIDGSTKKPVGFAVIVIQEAGLVINAPQGNYYVEIPKSGKYSVRIQSPGLESITTSITVEGNVVRDFTLNPFRSGGGSVVIRGEKDIQKVSRLTMSRKEIKEVPASFGDSINALTALPSVSRPGGIFGPLVIRGADPAVNGYYIDDIPLFNPMHFGGFHSVINNDLMKDIDLYASSYPSQFSNAQGAVININTIDEVEREGGNVDVGLISASSLIKFPITGSVTVDGTEKKENKGYIIASARIGYLSLFIPLFYKYVMGEELDQVPEYWDYQFKAKYMLNSSNSLTVLAFGSRDTMKLILKDDYLDEADDPYWADAKWNQDQQSHNVGIYYTYKPGERFENTVMVYGAMTDFYRWLDLPKSSAAWTHDITTESRPWIFGLKEKFSAEWWKSHGELKGGVEFNYYRFVADGVVVLPNTSEPFDPGDPDSFVQIPIDENVSNWTFVHYAENRFRFGWLTFVPGYHAEYLSLTKKHVFDPRGAVTVAFPTGTTIGAAGGFYSCFMQTSPYYFNVYPNIASDDSLDPQRAIHRAVSVEQKVSSYTFKTEGFYNTFNDVIDAEDMNSDGISDLYNVSELKAYGFEFMAKISEESEQGPFGWFSYTWSRSLLKSNKVTDAYGDEWINSYYDQTHVLKLVAGYTIGEHTVSGRFQFNSTMPYTPIVEGSGFESPSDSGRYVPGAFGKTNSGRLAPEHRLDLRYSRKTGYRWGFVSWYVEVINVYNYHPEQYRWHYRDNHAFTERTKGLAIIPNFGVEAKF